MTGWLERLFLQLTSKRETVSEPGPLLVELFAELHPGPVMSYQIFPFTYQIFRQAGRCYYEVRCNLSPAEIEMLRRSVFEASKAFEPETVEPLTFGRLIDVLAQLAAVYFDGSTLGPRVKEIAELAAYEAIGLSRFLALAKDERVTEFYVDSDVSPVYLDHIDAGRCETGIVLVARERHALETHLDTFRGYTLDRHTPSMKNDLDVSGARLRVCIDLEPLSVSGFALDVRRLNVRSLSMRELIDFKVLSAEAAGVLVAWVEAGGNCTIVGETGTGKTTLLNAIDELVEPELRRLYIEDAVETKDMLGRGFHQMKVKVDPFERGEERGRTKEYEIVKSLHRSPDLVILSEIQSEEHSRAFFHALAAGVRGLQTFHGSSIEQALRRWLNMHNVSEQSLLDLGLMVLMTRPDKLKPGRYVQRICEVVPENGTPKLRDLFLRDRDSRLRRLGAPDWLIPPTGVEAVDFEKKLNWVTKRTGLGQA